MAFTVPISGVLRNTLLSFLNCFTACVEVPGQWHTSETSKGRCQFLWVARVLKGVWGRNWEVSQETTEWLRAGKFDRRQPHNGIRPTSRSRISAPSPRSSLKCVCPYPKETLESGSKNKIKETSQIQSCSASKDFVVLLQNNYLEVFPPSPDTETLIPFSSLQKGLGRDHVCSPLVPQVLQIQAVEWVGRLSRETCSTFRQQSHPARILAYSALMRGKLQAGELGLHSEVVLYKTIFILPSPLDLPHPPNLCSNKAQTGKGLCYTGL